MNNNLTIMSNAPRFTCDSSIGPLKLTDYFGKWVILFSYPENFAPVSTTEIISLSKLNDEFTRRNCQILASSPETTNSHLAYIKDIEESTGNVVNFPLLSDTEKEINNAYNFGRNRNVFFIDPNQKIRCILVYPYDNGRNIPELLRIQEALIETSSNGNDTPANWNKNISSIARDNRSYINLIENIKKTNSRNCVDWYLNLNNQDLRRW